MNRETTMLSFRLAAVAAALTLGQLAGAAEPSLKRMEWTIEGGSRDALVSIPAAARTTDTPVVFVFHGHGGGSRNVAASFAIEKLWPEAIVVYMQGLPTPGRTDPEGKRSGWQRAVGDQGDRDLKFFDAVLATLRKDQKIDERRVYATGHSNGGGFTYLLWAARGDLFAAVAPSSAGAAGRNFQAMKPKPVLHLAGETDAIVPFANQKKTIDALRTLNGCDSVGQEWAKYCTLYPSRTGTPVVTYIHPGGHMFPAEAPQQFVRFFKEHPKDGAE
jgi:polyhydroxybutyrate depolymerase